jgi:hypothetical protein
MTSRRALSTALAAAAALLALAAAEPALAQCAMCKAVVESSVEGRAMSASLNRAILLMLFAPYVVAGSVAAVVLRGRLGAGARRLLARFRSP